MRFSFAEEQIQAQGWRELRRRRFRFPSLARSNWRPLTGLPIKAKLILTHAGIVFLVVVLLVWLTLGNYRSSLERRLLETCLLTARQLAESELVKANLLSPPEDELASADLQANVLSLAHLGVEGFRFAYVADRSLTIRAHTDFNMRGSKIEQEAFAPAFQLGKPQIRTRGGILEVAYPVVSRRPTPDGHPEPVVVGLVGVGLSRHEVLRPLYRAQRAAALGVVFVLLVSGLLIYFVSDRMTQQVDHLAEGIRRLGRGDLNTEIRVITQDELGTLAKEFNRMIVSLREKLEMQKYVSPLTVQMIHRKATNGAASDVSRLPQVAVVFSDVRNFSALADRLPPRQVVDLLNAYLDLQTRVVEQFGGLVDKFVGDEVMAVFLGKDQLRSAIRAACEIQRKIAELNGRRAAAGQPIAEVGIGIHTGPAVAGSVGSRDRKDHTVLGDVVNVAFRLCSLALPGQILVSERVKNAAGGPFQFGGEQHVRLKGKTQPLRIFELRWSSQAVEERK